MSTPPIALQSPSYFEQRMAEYGITPELNKIKLVDPEFREAGAQEKEIYTENTKYYPGSIDILFWTIDGEVMRLDRPSQSKLGKEYRATRLHPSLIEKNMAEDANNDGKFRYPKGYAPPPFFARQLVDYYKNREQRDTLIITEGPMKADYAGRHGFDIIGISSITTLLDKVTQQVPMGIISLIKECKYKNIILLHDGDATNLSRHALQEDGDLYTRPHTFFNQVIKFYDAFKNFDLSIYYAFIGADLPKGIDDLLLANKGSEPAILKDLLQTSKPCNYFEKFNIGLGMSKVKRAYGLNNATEFYHLHETEINELLKVSTDHSFQYNRSRYIYNEKTGECDLHIPGDAENYMRVGDGYLEIIHYPNKYDVMEVRLEPRRKETIIDDHGKSILNHIRKFKAFINKPDHVNYQRIVANCYNIYNPIEHHPVDGKWDNISMFLHHIFGSHYEVGMDWIQLIYQQPAVPLPVLCLVSKENNTGKSTFVTLMSRIFGENVVVVGNEQLTSNFNSIWAGKLLICVEETLVDKYATVQKIKSMVLSEKIIMNKKNAAETTIDNFSKFIMCSNDEKRFIIANQHDERYFVVKVPKFGKEIPGLISLMNEEIPAFLYFLNQRKMMYGKSEGRLWFPVKAYITEAFKALVSANTWKVEREIRQVIADAFTIFGRDEFCMDNKRLREYLKDQTGFNYRQSEIAEVLEEKFGMKSVATPGGYTHYYLERSPDPLTHEMYTEVKKENITGRYYTFVKGQFVQEAVDTNGQLREVIVPTVIADAEKKEEDLPF